MRSFPSCWNKTLAQLGFKRKLRKKSKRNDHLHRRSLFESLEQRQMLSADSILKSFHADGEDLQVAYSVTNPAVSSFSVEVYRSADGVTTDPADLLMSQAVTDTDMLQTGVTHQLSFQADFSNADDDNDDYYLVAQLTGTDSSGVLEPDSKKFTGGTFKEADGTVQIHGSDGADVIGANEEFTPYINFEDHTLLGYHASWQDVTPDNNEILDSGRKLRLWGNTWKAIEFKYQVTENTILEFDFESTVEGEIHGIGFDKDLLVSEPQHFQLHGTQFDGGNVRLHDYDNYDPANGVQHYRIAVGEFYTGDFDYLFFANDHDVSSPTGESIFSNIKVYENDPSKINFSDHSLLSYGGTGQDIAPDNNEILEEGNKLRLWGNTWKAINLPYEVTEHTILEFDFESTSRGEIHGVGFNNTVSALSPKTFQVYGTQYGVEYHEHHNYKPENGVQHYRIPVGEFFTGSFNYLTFSNDHDVSSPTGESIFSNVRLYEDRSTIDFSQYTNVNYGGGQTYTHGGNVPSYTVSGDGSSITLENNIYQAIPFAYHVTENTVVEFDYSSTLEGEIHGFGFDDDLNVTASREFKLHGTQPNTFGWHDIDSAYQLSEGNRHYRIKVGERYTGKFDHLFFFLDSDATGTGNSTFSNFRVYESEPDVVDLRDHTLSSYGGSGQDVNPSNNEVFDEGNKLRLWGNTWKAIDLPYEVTENTILEFDFESTDQGEIHGVGFSNSVSTLSPKTFQVYGTQYGVEYHNHHNYKPENGVQHYRIPVGEFFTGNFDYLTFSNDHDVSSPTGESIFSNIRLYEGTSSYVIRAHDGDDVVSTNVPDAKPVSVHGGLGDDTFIVGNQSDSNLLLSDQAGNDTIDLLSNWTGPTGAMLGLGLDGVQTVSQAGSPGLVQLEIAPDDDIENVIGTGLGDILFEVGANNEILVSTATDVSDGDYSSGNLSLREALSLASLLPGEDTIAFDLDFTNPQTITLSGSELLIDSSVTITGPSQDLLTISANTNTSSQSRVFNIPAGNDVAIGGITIANGYVEAAGGGAGIYNLGNLTLEEATLVNNVAVEIDQSIGGWGGAIYNQTGALTVRNSTFEANTGRWGGAVWINQHSASAQDVQIFGSTFLNNSAENLRVNPVSTYAVGGGVFVQGVNAQTLIANSTFSGNSALHGGAVRGNERANIKIVNSTLSENHADGSGGGISVSHGSASSGSIVTIQNSIIAGNTAVSGPDDVSFQSGVLQQTESTHNILGENTQGYFDALENTIGQDPMLAPLGNYGGSTQTYALMSNSPAIDMGDMGVATLQDQRGLASLDFTGLGFEGGSPRDVGAFESSNLSALSIDPTLTVSVVEDRLDINPTNDLSLREALIQAFLSDGPNKIEFDENVFSTPRDIILADHDNDFSSDTLLLNSDITINGPGSELLSIRGNHVRVFEVEASQNVTIRGLTVRDGDNDDGAGIYNNGNLSLESVVVRDNGNPFWAGGGILNNSGNLSIVDSLITDNSAASGGGILNRASLTINNSTISDNWAMYGGGLAAHSKSDPILDPASVVITNSTISNNSAMVRGGGVNFNDFYNSGLSFIAQNSTISGNSAGSSGAGINAKFGSQFDPGKYDKVELTNVTITENVVDYMYGPPGASGLHVEPNTDPINNQLLANNTIIAGNITKNNGVEVASTDVQTPLSFQSSHTNIFGNSVQGITDAIYGNMILPAGTPLGLMPLGDYGGSTQTHALLPDSPAIDAGDDAAAVSLTTDQRGNGYDRIIDADGDGATDNVDIGAFEAPIAWDLDLDSSEQGVDSSVEFFAGGGPVTIAPNAAFTGIADRVTVTFSELSPYYFDRDADTISASPSNSAIEVESQPGRLVLTGLSLAADYQQALQSIAFNNNNADVHSAPRQVEIEVFYQSQQVASAKATIQPVVTGTVFVQAIEDISEIDPSTGIAAGPDDPVLFVDDDADNRAYIKFELPTGVNSVSEAYLSLYTTGFYDDDDLLGPQTLKVYEFNTGWSEVAPPNQGTLGSHIGDIEANRGQYSTLDITTAVNNAILNNETFVSFAVVDGESNDTITQLASSEHADVAWRPRLSISGQFANNAPVSLPDTYHYEFYKDGTNRHLDVPVESGVLAVNDTDPDGNSLTASLTSEPRHGDIFFNEDGSFYYIPNEGFTGGDSFSYRAFDGLSYGEITNVSIRPVPSRAIQIGQIPVDIIGEQAEKDAEEDLYLNLANPHINGVEVFDDSVLYEYTFETDCDDDGYGNCVSPITILVAGIQPDIPNHTASVEFDVSSLQGLTDPTNQIASVHLELPQIASAWYLVPYYLETLGTTHYDGPLDVSVAPGVKAINKIVGIDSHWLYDVAPNFGSEYYITEIDGIASNILQQDRRQINPISASAFWGGYFNVQNNEGTIVDESNRRNALFDITDVIRSKVENDFGSDPNTISFGINGLTPLSLGFARDAGRLIVTLAESADLPQSPDDPGGANEAPYFTSEHKTTATIGKTFEYTLIASDPDNDTLEYGLPEVAIQWPEGYSPAEGDKPTFMPSADGSRAFMTWNPAVELIGETVTFREQVRDTAGHLVSRTFEVYVEQDPQNQAPVIIADANLSFTLPEAPVPSGNTGSITSPDFIDLLLAEGDIASESINVQLNGNELRSEIVFVLDTTGSMHYGQGWISKALPIIDKELWKRGFGNQTAPHDLNDSNRVYGLTTFSDSINIRPVATNGDIWGTAAELLTYSHSVGGGEEAGYHALAEVLGLDGNGDGNAEGYSFNNGDHPAEFTSSQIVLISDNNVADGFNDITDNPNIPGDALEENLAEKADLRNQIVDKLLNNTSTAIDDVILSTIVDARYDGSTAALEKPTGFEEVAGTWLQDESSYIGSSAPEAWAISVVVPYFENVQYSSWNSRIKTSISIDEGQQNGGNAYVVFDYEDDQNFKFVAAYADSNQWRIGEVNNGAIVNEPASNGDGYKGELDASAGVYAGQTYDIEIWTDGGERVYLSVNGKDVGDHLFESADIIFSSGKVGLATFGSSASFSRFSVGPKDVLFDYRYTTANVAYEFGTDGTAFPVMGIDSTGSAYYAEPGNSFSKGNFESVVYSLDFDLGHYYSDTYEDYVTLALETGGSAWDQSLLRVLGDNNASEDEKDFIGGAFAAAFAEAISSQAARTISPLEIGSGTPIPVEIEVNHDSLDAQGTDGLLADVKFTGDGSSHFFQLGIEQDGNPLGQVPVRITAPYVVDFDAHDPDGPPDLVFEFAAGSWMASDETEISPKLVSTGREGILNDRFVWDTSFLDLTESRDYEFGVTVRDGKNLYAVEEYWWTVTVHPPATNNAPEIVDVIPNKDGNTLTPPDATVGAGYQIEVVATDQDNDHLRYYIDDPTGNMSIDPNTGVIQWVPASTGSVHVTVRVSDGRTIAPPQGQTVYTLGEDTHTFTIQVNERTFANLAPNLAPIPSGYLFIGESISHKTSATDLNGDTLTYTLLGAPDWMDITPDGVIVGSPKLEDVNTLSTVTVTASDGRGKSDSETFQIVVLSNNHDPEFRSEPHNAGTDADFSYRLEAYDRDGHAVEFYLEDPPTGMTIDERPDGVYVVWPASEMTVGFHPVRIVADDLNGGFDYQEFELEVKEFAPPVFDGQFRTRIPANTLYESTFSVVSKSPILSADNIYLDAGSIARGITIDTNTIDFSDTGSSLQQDGLYHYDGLKVTWTPGYEDEFEIEIFATNQAGVTSSFPYNVTVLPEVLSPEQNLGPVINTFALGPFAVGQTYDFTLDIEDPNGHEVTAVNVVTGTDAPGFDQTSMGFNGNIRRIRWTPTKAGDFTIVLQAVDALGAASEPKSIQISVAANAGPKISRDPASAAFFGKYYTYDFTVSDPNPEDVPKVTLNPEAEAAGMRLVESNTTPGDWQLIWQSPGPIGSQTPIRIEVTDGRGGLAASSFTLPVFDPDLEVSPIDPGQDAIKIPFGKKFEYHLVAQVPDELLPTFELKPVGSESLPEGIRLAKDGVLSWRPTYAQSGGSVSDSITYDFQIIVDGDTENPVDISFEVIKPDDFDPVVPEINSSAPISATANRLYRFEPTVEDGTGYQQIQWTLDEGGDKLKHNPLTNEFTWLPDEADIGKSIDVVLRATDSIGQTDIQTFSIEVVGAAAAPAITTTFPGAWNAEQEFSFTVTASHKFDHELVFDLFDLKGTALPAGLDIASDTGEITWDEPAEGTYDWIIRVSEKYDPASFYDWRVKLSVAPSTTTTEVDPIIQDVPHGLNASVGSTFSHQLSLWDLEGVVTDWEVVSMTEVDSGDSVESPDIATISGSGLLSWTPTAEQADKMFSVTVRAYEDSVGGEETFVTFDLNAIDNAAPVVTLPTNLEGVVGTTYRYDVSARDPDGNTLTYALNNALDESGTATNAVTIDPQTGQIEWNVPAVETAYVTFDLLVTDEHGLTKEISDVQIDAKADDIAPTINLWVEDGEENVVKPSDILHSGSYSDYTIWFQIEDNLGQAAGEVNWLLEAFDSAGHNIEGISTFKLWEHYGGRIAAKFTAPFNSGLIFFKITAGDEDNVDLDSLQDDPDHDDILGNPITRTFRYNASAADQEKYAQLINVDKPGDVLVVDERFEVRGTANATGATFELRLIPVDSPQDFVVIASGDANRSGDSPLGTIDPTLVKSGQYRVYLEVGSGNNITGIDEQIIEIRNDSRLGNLDLSFTDLSVDLGGIPVSLVRSYSSALVSEGTASVGGDFGPGWTLNFLQSGIQVGHPDQITTNLNEPFADRTRLLVELPDGSIHRFEFDAESINKTGNGPFRPVFRPDPDVYSTLELANLDASLLLTPNEQRQDGTFISTNTNQAFLPANFGTALVLTTQSGLRYLFDVSTGKLTAIEDENDRRVTITHDEDNSTTTIATASDVASQQIVIHYDTQGRIDWIKDPLIEDDPDDKVITYRYGDYVANTGLVDESAEIQNLSEVINRNGNKVNYDYEEGTFHHHLTEIFDNSGIRVLQAEYYEAGEFDLEGSVDGKEVGAGRLKNLIDASDQGADLDFTIDLGGGRMVTRVDDGNGIVVDEVTNNRGNVLRRVQEIGQDEFLVTSFVYNNRGLLTHQSVPYVVTGVDERYDSPIDPVSDSEDPADRLRWAQIITYDEKDRTVSTSDALGNTTSFKYDEDDRIIETTDPNGIVTHNIYDSYTGNLLKTYVTYGESSQRYNHSRFVYDNYGRVLETYQVDLQNEDEPELLVSRTHYDSSTGRVAWTEDVNGQKRYFGYDANGNQTHSWSNWTNGVTSVATVSLTIYDAEGRVTDTKEYELDEDYTESEFNLLKADIDNATPLWTTNTQYDSQGRVSQSTDRYENITQTVYDIRGNVIESRTQVKDELDADGWMVTRTLYDDQGRVLFSADPYYSSGTANPAAVSPVLYGSYTHYDSLGRVDLTERHSGVIIELRDDDLDGNTEPSDTDGILGAYSNYDFTDATTNPAISSSSTHYDNLGRVQYTINESGARTDYYYDANGRQVATLGPVVDVLLGGTGEPRRLLTIPTHDPGGRLIQSATSISLTGTTAPHPDLFNETTQQFNESLLDRSKQQTTFYEYDTAGRQTAVITTNIEDPDNSSLRTHLRSETVYDAFGRRLQNITGLKQADPYNPDTINRDSERITSHEYDNAGNLIAVNLPMIELADDPETTGVPNDAINVRPRYEYQFDQYGNRTAITTNAYLTEDGNTVVYLGKDANGIDEVRHSRSITDDVPDAAEILLTTTTLFTYDHNGRQLSRQLPEGLGTNGFKETMLYEETQKLYALTEPQRTDSVVKGQLKLSIDFQGRVTAYSYDNTAEGGGRLIEKRYYESSSDYGSDIVAETVSYEYDEFGRQVETDHSVRGTTTNHYDDEGRLTQVDSPEGTINYAYDPITGQITDTWTGTAGQGLAATHTEYVYDTLGRMQRVISHRAGNVDTDDATEYFYDLVGNLARVIYGNNLLVTDYTYDELNRLTKMVNYKDTGIIPDLFESSDLIRSSYEYEIDLFSKRTAATEIINTGSNNSTAVTTAIDWQYDELGRLVSEKYDYQPGTNSNDDFWAEYDFDLVGNRLEKRVDKNYLGNAGVDETISYLYDDNDRMLREQKNITIGTADDTTTFYGYDHTQRVSKHEYSQIQTTEPSSGKISTTTFAYNVQGRMESTTVDTDGDGSGASPVTTTYEYDDSGIRVTQQVGAGPKTTYLVDKNNPTGYAQVLEEGVDDNGTAGLQADEVDMSYVIGHDVIAQATAAALQYLMYDGHGSTRAVLDDLANVITGGAGNKEQLFAYDAYGNLVGPSNVFVQEIANAITTLLYSGEQTDASTGLQYLRARYYDPESGSFNRLDPFAGNFEDPQSLHKYLYTHADPVNGIDPSGEYLAYLLPIFYSLAEAASSGALASGAIYYSPHVAVVALGTIAVYSIINYSVGEEPVGAESVRIRMALDLIAKTDPVWAQKNQNLDIAIDSLWGDRVAAVLQFSDQIVLDDDSIRLPIEFIAALIVHEATHVNQGYFERFFSSEATIERPAHQAESDFLKKLGIVGPPIELIKKYPNREYVHLFIYGRSSEFNRFKIDDPAF